MHLLDVTMFWSEQGGGVQRYLRAKNAYLHTLENVRHSILVPGRLTANPPELPGIPIPFGSGYRLPRNRGAVQKALRTLSPDLIEAGDPYQLAWAAVKWGQQRGVPVTAFYHSDVPELVGRAFGEYARRAAQTYVKRLYRHFDQVFAPSRYVAERLADLGIDRVTLQPLGVDTHLFHPSRRDEAWRRSRDIPLDARVLLYVGRYAPEKNLEVLVDAVNRLGDPYVLVTIGGGSSPPAGERVICLPYEAHPGLLASAYASAELFVHAGDQETFGLSVLEAMASGLPVVGCAAAGVGELIDERVGRRVRSCTGAAFADAIRAVETEDRDDLCAQARARAENFDWSAVLPRLMDHYYRLNARAHRVAQFDRRAA